MSLQAALTLEELTGRAATHVVAVEGGPVRLHRDVAAPYLALCAAGREAGLAISAVSGFRDFERQRQIWNAKYRGERPLLDRAGRPLDAAALTPRERVAAILLWSALPGASRHHWGTDLDVIDTAALAPGEQAHLVPEEFAAQGVFARLNRFLEARAGDFGFYRPYARDAGGVMPEPWHLSHMATAQAALAALSPTVLARALSGAGLEGESLILELLPELYARYVANVEPIPGAAPARANV